MRGIGYAKRFIISSGPWSRVIKKKKEEKEKKRKKKKKKRREEEANEEERKKDRRTQQQQHSNYPKHTMFAVREAAPKLTHEAALVACFTCEGDVLTEDSRCHEHKGR